MECDYHLLIEIKKMLENLEKIMGQIEKDLQKLSQDKDKLSTHYFMTEMTQKEFEEMCKDSDVKLYKFNTIQKDKHE